MVHVHGYHALPNVRNMSKALGFMADRWPCYLFCSSRSSSSPCVPLAPVETMELSGLTLLLRLSLVRGWLPGAACGLLG